MENNKFNIDTIKFDEKGLVVAIATDVKTNKVLMQAFMNKESLKLTLETHKAHYFSRSRNKLWLKGEESGHFQEVVSIVSDCDNDSILMRVIQTGNACHTGEYSCFFNNFQENKYFADIDIIQKNIDTIKERKTNVQEGSYTCYLLDKGKEKICKKVGEESSEVIIAAMKDDNEELKCEIADLYYHTLVLMQAQNLDFNEVLKELELRHKNERKRNY